MLIRYKDRRASAAVIPAQAGIQSVRFQPYPTDSCRVAVLDSRLRGNDGISVAAKSIKKGHML
ncbi:TPA: hypothetical protein ACFKWU_04735 [Neisseria gonorrhoeae]